MELKKALLWCDKNISQYYSTCITEHFGRAYIHSKDLWLSCCQFCSLNCKEFHFIVALDAWFFALPVVFNQWLKHYLKCQPSLQIITLATRWKKTNFAQREMNNIEIGPAVETRLMSEVCLAISGSVIQPVLHISLYNVIEYLSPQKVDFGSIWAWKYILQFGLSSLQSIYYIWVSIV